MLHPDSQLGACKEKDIVMLRANSQKDGVRTRLRLTNHMRTSLSLASNVHWILLHGEDKKILYPAWAVQFRFKMHEQVRQRTRDGSG